MDVKISCDTYFRLSHVCRVLKPFDNEEILKSLYIERKDGHIYVIACSRMLAAVEFIGSDDGPDGGFLVDVNETLQQQTETERAFNSEILLNYNEPLSFLSLKTTFGYSYPGNATSFPGQTGQFPNWRKWFPDEMPKKSAGAMHLPTEIIGDLLKSCPSGKVVFPRTIDSNKPVVLRDIVADNWVGLFMPVLMKGGEHVEIEPATVPEWVK